MLGTESSSVDISSRPNELSAVELAAKLSQQRSYQKRKVLNMATDEQLLKLKDWIERIRGEITKLFFHDHVFWEVQDIIRTNPRLEQSKSYFYEWMGDAFVYSAAMFVRRQIDMRRDSISLLRLLRELSRNPTLINRENFLDRTTLRNTVLARINSKHTNKAEEIFDEFVGIGKNHLERDEINDDIKQLMDQSRRFKEFADHYVAHHSSKEMPSDNPTFSDLDDCIDFMVSLLEKYYLLVTGNRMPSLSKESFDPIWKDIFTFAWLEPDKAGN